jgi:hypothetical protein
VTTMSAEDVTSSADTEQRWQAPDIA